MVTASHDARWRTLARYVRDPAAFMLDAGPGNDLVRIRLGPRDFWLVNHPDLIEQVLTRPEGLRRDRIFREATRFVGESHTTKDGPAHRERRRLLEPNLAASHVQRFGERVVAGAARRARAWEDGAVVDINGEMLELMLAILTDVLLDLDVETDAREIGEAVTATLKVVHRLFLPGAGVLWRVPLPATRRFDRAVERADALIYRLIRERRRPEGRREEVLSALLQAEDGDGRGLTDRETRDELVTLLFGGRGDLAQAATWTWHLVAGHPEIEERWHTELDEALEGRSPGSDDLPRLPYTRMIFWEALRLYPPGWIFVREVAADYMLEDFVVPRGAAIMVCPLVTHRDARYWAAPLRFDPGRWTVDAEKARRPYTDLTFGGGNRICLGRHIAAIVGPLALATLAQQWRPRHVPGEGVALRGAFNLEPKGGLRMRLERRR